jgi:putative Mn2+ efflux pump MntP
MAVSIILTACLVSVDAFFIGLCVKIPRILFILCILTLFAFTSFIISDFFNWADDNMAGYLSGVIFILLGIKNFFNKDGKSNFSSVYSVVLACAMSVDVIVATLTLCISGAGVFSPIAVIAAHAIALLFGFFISPYIIISPRAKKYLPALGFITIGLLKLSGVI